MQEEAKLSARAVVSRDTDQAAQEEWLSWRAKKKKTGGQELGQVPGENGTKGEKEGQ